MSEDKLGNLTGRSENVKAANVKYLSDLHKPMCALHPTIRKQFELNVCVKGITRFSTDKI